MEPSQSAFPPKNAGKVPLRYGLLFGCIVSFIDLIYSYLVDTGAFRTYDDLLASLYNLNASLFAAIGGAIISMPIYILLCITFFLAGIGAGRVSKRGGTGALAGLVTGGIFLIIDLLVTFLLNLVFGLPLIARNIPQDIAGIENIILISSVIYKAVIDLILLGLSAGIGALGGVMGKGLAATQMQSQISPDKAWFL